MEENYAIISQQPTSAGRLCNFEDLIINNGDQIINIVVPKIQRAYAQGRIREKNIREHFISQILESLSKGEDMELNFVYGSKSTSEYGTTFELLDGQQRLTTLFLLYWYFARVEGGDKPIIPEALKYFSYETRTTSTDFIKKLVESNIDVSNMDKVPSESICGRQWYTIAFDKDSTVEGMLTMLDTIHQLYNKLGRPSGMLTNLSKIRFYELNLIDFGLTEEIYIKMNARGLQLSPFENYKADLVKYMKDENNLNYKEEVKMNIIGCPEVQYYLRFSQKLDSKWLNLFWLKNDEDNNVYCDKFFRFFYRYFSTKYYLEVKKDITAQEFRPKRDDIWDFFWTDSPKQSSNIDKTYLGFTNYKTVLDDHSDYIRSIEIVLDALCQDDVKNLLSSDLCAPWNISIKCNFFEEEYKLQDAVMFAAITEFIEASVNNVDITNLKRWIRVVWNCTENQLFQNINELVSTVRNLSEIIRTYGATHDVYGTMSKFIERTEYKNYSRAIREEIKKAQMITNNPNKDWESAFIKAEKHPFFKGAIGFFLFTISPKTPEAFLHRYEILGQMFDVKGITQRFRDNHILIMSMIRQLNSPEKMGISKDGTINISITERYDTLNHLKSVLIEKEAIQKMLCTIGDLPSVDDAFAALQCIMKSDVSFDESSVANNYLKGKLSRAFKRLAYDKKLYDFIENEEDATHILEFTFLDKLHYAVNKRRSWYRKLFIESERNLIIPMILKLGYSLEDVNEKEVFEKYGDYFGYDVWLSKALENGCILQLKFYRGDGVEFYINKPTEDILNLFSVKEDDNGRFMLLKMTYQTQEDDYQLITNAINKIENAF